MLLFSGAVWSLLSFPGEMGPRIRQDNCIGKVPHILCYPFDGHWSILCSNGQAFSAQREKYTGRNARTQAGKYSICYLSNRYLFYVNCS